MGFAGPVLRIAQYFRLMSRATIALRAEKPDIVVVIDAPDFHLPFLRRIKRDGRRVLYFVPPQVWAWRAGRAREVAQLCDSVITLFRWEREWFTYSMENSRVHWVGHPLADDLPELAQKRAFSNELFLLPGSRKGEIMRMTPLFSEVASLLSMRHVFVAADSDCEKWIASALVGKCRGDAQILQAPVQGVLPRARACVACAGTVTLEAACAGLPVVIVYKTDLLTYSVARRLVRMPWCGLPNILLKRSAYPECVQVDATARKIATALSDAMAAPRATWVRAARELREQLGEPGVAARAAQIVLGLATKSTRIRDGLC
jgi:lipid-A-disaccharide synthase